MKNDSVEIHRGKIFTLTQDPYRSYDLPNYSDCFRYDKDGALIVDPQSGIILDMGSWNDLDSYRQSGAKVVDHRPHWIFPGFIDGHTHLPQLPVAGRSGLLLQDWLKRYIYPTEARFKDPEFARKVSKRFFEKLRGSGATTAVVMTTIHTEATQIAFEAAMESGLRVYMGKMLMDMNAPSNILEDYKTAMKGSNKLCDAWHGQSKGLLSYVYSPRFAITCSRQLMEACGKEARMRKVAIHTHLNESKAEVASAEQIHPWAANYTDIYLKTGLIEESHLNILAHQIYPSSEELMALRGLPVCTVHCPSANDALRSGEFDFLHLYSHGMDRIALGSDVGAGPHLSLFDVMRSASSISNNDLTIYQLYYLATLGGAKALGLATGALMKGYEADFVVLNPESANPFPEEPIQSLEEVLLVMLARTSEATPVVLKSYVRGKQIYSRESE